jgi:hypothetical protein
MTTDIKTELSKIGWYQIIGGAIGIVIILYSVFSSVEISGLNTLIYVFMLLFFIYSIFCGTLCLRCRDKALTHSLINQFLQLIGFAVLGFAFAYVAGFYLSVGLDFSNSLDIKFDIGISKFDFNVNREYERTEISFNLVAFGLVYRINKLMKKVKVEKDNTEIASIGK